MAVKKDKIVAVVDMGGYTDDELRRIAGTAKAVKERMDMMEKAAKSVLEDRMTPGVDEPIMVDGQQVGMLKLSKGGAKGKYKVADPAAYAAWLETHDRGRFTQPTAMPVEEAMSDGYLSALIVEEGTGEIPAGVKYVPPRAPVVSATLDDAMVDRMFTGKALGFTERLLTGAETEVELTVVDVPPVETSPVESKPEPAADTTPVASAPEGTPTVEPEPAVEPTVDVFASMGL